MADKNEIRVKFEIGEIKFEAEGSADLVERERSIFNNTLLPAAIDAIVRTHGVIENTQYTNSLGTSIQPVIEGPGSARALPGQAHMVLAEDLSRTSLASFVKGKGASEHYDFIICAAYYNEQKNGVSAFSSATLKELYSDAKRPLPGNLSMSLSELVKKGLIMEDPSSKGSNPKVYVLTADGEDAVNNMLPREQKEKKTSSKSRKQHQKSESVYANISCDELNLCKYPEVKLLKSFKEKMMLILYIITNEGKGEWFTMADVLFLMTDIFGEVATSKQVDGVFRREKRWFKAENIDGSNKLVHRKLMNEGKSYAQSLTIGNE